MIRRRTSALYEHADVVSTQYAEQVEEHFKERIEEEQFKEEGWSEERIEVYQKRVRELNGQLRNPKHRR